MVVRILRSLGRRGWLSIVAALLVVAAILWAYRLTRPTTHDFVVNVTLARESYVDASGDCRGVGPYGDIRRGARVLILDARGRRIASSELGRASGAELGGTEGVRRIPCVFAVRIDDVRQTGGYRLKVASHVGQLMSKHDVSANECCLEWLLHLRLDDESP